MRFARRFMFTLLGGVALISLAFAVYQAEAERRVLEGQVQRQAAVLAESLRQAVEQMLPRSSSSRDLEILTDQFRYDDQWAGVAVYGATGQPIAITSSLASNLTGTPAQ